MLSVTKRIVTILGTGLLLSFILCAILPFKVHAGAGTSNIRWSISCNLDYFFSPFERMNKDLRNGGLPEIARSTPQLGVELARYKFDPAGNAKRSLGFLYFYWQAKAESGDKQVQVYFHEFSAKARVYLLPHLAVAPFLGCGVGFQRGTIRIFRPAPVAIVELEGVASGGVLTLLGGIEWQMKPEGGVFRLEGGYRHMPSSSMPRHHSITTNTSCWFLGLTAGMKM